MTALFESQEVLRVILRAHKADKLALRKDTNGKHARDAKKTRDYLSDKAVTDAINDVGYWD